MVSDWVWIPAAIAIPVSFWESGNLWWLTASKLAILAVAAVATYFLGVFGQADSIALFFMLVFFLADSFAFFFMGIVSGYLSPLPQLICMCIASLVHISYLALRSGSIRIEKFMSVEEAERQNVWIPREVEAEGARVQLSSSPEEAWESLKK